MIARDNEPKIRTKLAGSSVRESEDKKIPRRKPVFPLSAERELARVFLGVSKDIIEISKPYLGKIAESYAMDNVREDAKMVLPDKISKILADFGKAIEKKINVRGILAGVTRVSKIARNISLRDWRNLVEDAVGEEISEPFYVETMEDLMDKWIGESVSYITTMPQEYLAKIHEIIEWGYDTNQPMVNVYRRLERETGMTRSHAKMIARDQMGTLNSRMTQYEHESMGVTHYRWVTKHDSRVRECHRQLDGKIFSWNNPPAMWYSTVSRGIVYTGRYCNPGEDYMCRCVASPVFDVERARAEIVRQKVRKR